jgi:hypothetical protein
MNQSQGTKVMSGRRVRGLGRRRSAGAVMVEYSFLLVFFGIPVFASTAALGVAMIQGYGTIRNDILHKYP